MSKQKTNFLEKIGTYQGVKLQNYKILGWNKILFFWKNVEEKLKKSLGFGGIRKYLWKFQGYKNFEIFIKIVKIFGTFSLKIIKISGNHWTINMKITKA